MLEPTAGQVGLLGRSWSTNEADLRERVGVGLQETHLPEKLTVEEVLTLFRSFYRRPRALDDLLSEVELTEDGGHGWAGFPGGSGSDWPSRAPWSASPGPLSRRAHHGLDPQSRRQVWGLIAAYRARGGTVVLTTHYMEEATRLCDRVGIVECGRMVRVGSPAELIAQLPATTSIELEWKRATAQLTRDELLALPSVAEAQLSGEGVWWISARSPRLARRHVGVGRAQRGAAGSSRNSQGIPRRRFRRLDGKASGRWLSSRHCRSRQPHAHGEPDRPTHPHASARRSDGNLVSCSGRSVSRFCYPWRWALRFVCEAPIRSWWQPCPACRPSLVAPSPRPGCGSRTSSRRRRRPSYALAGSAWSSFRRRCLANP